MSTFKAIKVSMYRSQFAAQTQARSKLNASSRKVHSGGDEPNETTNNDTTAGTITLNQKQTGRTYDMPTTTSASTSPSVPACEASATSIIHGEIVAVTSAMRRNARWASSSPSAYVPGIADGSGRGGLASSMGLRNTINGTLLSGDEREGMEDGGGGGLMAGFSVLMLALRECEDTGQLDALTLLQPFLSVVRSGDTTGPITAIALSSIDKFLTFSLVHPESPSIALAMSQVSGAGTHCRFEASDSVGDEVVLLKILDVLRNALTGKVGYILTDEAVCEMMETGLSMCCQMRLSEMLRRSAERTMQAMVSSIFQRLRELPVSVDASYVPPDDESDDGQNAKDGLRMTAPNPHSASIPAASAASEARETKERSATAETPEAGLVNGEAFADSEAQEVQVPLLAEKPLDTASTAAAAPEETEDAILELLPYGLASIKELLRVLISLLDPYDAQHTDSMRLTSLGILTTAFEVAGKSIGKFPSLRVMISDELCKHLFQLIRSDNTTILAAALRCMTNVLDTMRPHLKMHLELFLSYLMDRLRPPSAVAIGKMAQPSGDVEGDLDDATWNRDASDGAAPPPPRHGSPAPGAIRSQAMAPRIGMVAMGEARQLMLEHLAHFARAPDFMVNLWVNYDCNVDCDDVFERVIRFFSRGVYPTSSTFAQTQDTSQLLCLDTLLAFVGHMSRRLDSGSTPSVDVPAPVLLARDKVGKRDLLAGAARFNEKPKDGLKFLEEKGIIYEDPSLPRPQSLALFFKACPRLDKKLLGDFISRPDNLEVLKAFMLLFDFRDKIMSDCLRELLETFRLPGESQQIARITEVFADVYVAAGSSEVITSDAAYVLAYSIIMLNTDQHNPQNRKKMTLDDYKRNLRGVNDGKDFPAEHLKAIYDSIRKREIVMPEEHTGQLGFEYAWKELQRRTRQAGPLITCNTAIFDRAMFEVSWRPVISSLSYAFTHFHDDYMLQRAVAGFRQSATLASRFNLPEVFDHTVGALAKITNLIHLPSSDVNFPTVDAEGQQLTISPLSIRFGKNFKAQLAAVVLFTVADSNGASLQGGWTHIFEIMQSLFAHSLLPASLLTLPDFANVGTIPLRPPKAQLGVPERRGDSGLLSTLSSYLLSPYVGPQDGIGRDITDDDVESTLCSVDCLTSCRIPEVYEGIFKLPLNAQENLLRSLVDLADRALSKSNRPRASSAADSPPSSPQLSRVPQSYDPCALFLLEMVVAVAARDPASLPRLWAPTFDHISKVLANSTAFSPLLVERAVAGLLRLQAAAVVQEQLRDQFFLALDVLQSLPAAVLSSVAEPMVRGVCQIASEHPEVFVTSTQWNMLFAIFIATVGNEDAARISFDLLQRIASGAVSPGLVPDNFGPFTHALDAFASMAGPTVSRRGANTKDPALERAIAAMNMLRLAQEEIPKLTEHTKAESDLTTPWESLWMPILLAYSRQGINGNREVRQLALGSLQRSLVAPEILNTGRVDLTIIFERVLFPVLEELLKPQIFRRDPEGMGETRLRASGLLCKIFLHYLVQLSQQGMGRMTELWVQILGYLDRFMHSGRRDQMYEAVPENLKNVLLVMNASGFLVPPYENPTPEQSNLWKATFDSSQQNIVLETLKHDLFPAPPPVEAREDGKSTKPENGANDTVSAES